MRVDSFEFGKISINSQLYTHDIIIIDNRLIEERRKHLSRALKSQYRHTPLTTAENIPWNCKTLVIGTGVNGRLPIAEEVRSRAYEMSVNLITKPTPDAIKHINDSDTNLILHITC